MTKGTIRTKSPFNPGDEAGTLRHAMKGLGTDEQAIIKCLSNLTYVQRHEVQMEYRKRYGRDLIADLKDDLSGDFCDVCIAMMTHPRLYDAQQLHQAIVRPGTDESDLLEIIATRSNDELKEIRVYYSRDGRNTLVHDLKSDTSGLFGKMLVDLVELGRRDLTDCADAKQIAQRLAKEGINDQDELKQIFTRSDLSHLRQICDRYYQLTSRTMEDGIRKMSSGDLEDAFLAIVNIAKNMPEFFARCLNRCMSRPGTKDNDLIRIIVSRSEIDLEDIKKEYMKLYQKMLSSVVDSETSGDYRKMLLAIIK